MRATDEQPLAQPRVAILRSFADGELIVDAFGCSGHQGAVVATKGQISSDLGDEVAILDLEGGMYYGLDNAGAREWELIQEPRSVSEVYATIVDEYDVESECCERDVVSLLQKLWDEGLIEIWIERMPNSLSNPAAFPQRSGQR